MSLPTSAQAWSLPKDAALWKDHHSLSLRSVDILPPGKGQDIMISCGQYPGTISTGPDGNGHIPGSDGAGEIVAVGEAVTEWALGDRVTTAMFEDWVSGDFKREYLHSALGGGVSGCLVQYRVFPSSTLVRIPSYLTYEEAATLPCAGVTAWACLFETASQPVGPHSTVLVQGSGGVSIAAAQLSKAAGARVIATTSNVEKADKYKAFVGVDEVINYRNTPEWSVDVLRLTDGKGVEQVLEIGGQTTMLQSLKSVQPGGHIHMLGLVGGLDDTNGIKFGELLIEVILGRINLHGHASGSKDMLQRMVNFLEYHKIKPVISKVFEFPEAVEALDYMAGGMHMGKIVVRI